MKAIDRNFFVPAGRVAWAQKLDYPPRFITDGRIQRNGSSYNYTKQQREGLRYERRALSYLQELVEKREARDFTLEQSNWFMFKSEGQVDSNPRFCQTDGLLFNEREKKLIIVEIKLQHTNSAWRQIRLLYEPILRVVYPSYSICALELCKWLDPHSSFPEQYFYAEDIFAGTPEKFGIHLYKPGREKKLYKKQSKRRGL